MLFRSIVHAFKHHRLRKVEHHTPPAVVIRQQRRSNDAVDTHFVRKELQKAGISGVRLGAHVLRHTVASTMVNRGASFKEVADVLGHKSLRTTGIYAKLDLTSLAAVALPWSGVADE